MNIDILHCKVVRCKVIPLIQKNQNTNLKNVLGDVPVVLDVGDLLGVAEVNQSRLRQLKAEIFILKSEKVKK